MANSENEQMETLEGPSKKEKARGKLTGLSIDFHQGGAIIKPNYEKGPYTSRGEICKSVEDLVEKVEEYASKADMTSEPPQPKGKGSEPEEEEGEGAEGAAAPAEPEEDAGAYEAGE